MFLKKNVFCVSFEEDDDCRVELGVLNAGMNRTKCKGEHELAAPFSNDDRVVEEECRPEPAR
jgi:hypothetical protein